MWIEIIGWNGPQDIKATSSEERRPTVERQKCKPFINIHSSLKAIHESIFDITDIHNSNMNVYNSIIDIHKSVMYINNLITDIKTCIIEK